MIGDLRAERMRIGRVSNPHMSVRFGMIKHMETKMRTITPEGLFGYIHRDLLAFLPAQPRVWSGFVPSTPRRREFYAFAGAALDRLENGAGLTDGEVEAILDRWLQLRAPFVAPLAFRSRPWNWWRYLKELPPMSIGTAG